MVSEEGDELSKELPFDDETFGLSQEEAESTYSYADAVVQRLQGMGLDTRNDRPRLEDDHDGIFHELKSGDYFDGRLPTVLKRLSLEQVSSLYSLFSAWYAYVISILNEVQTSRSEAMQQKDLMWSMVRMKHLKGAKKIGVNLSDQRLSDLARYDERFVTANREYVEFTALRDCIESLRKIAEKDMEVVSREVTVRDVQINAEARGRSIGGPSRFATDRYQGTPENMPTKRRSIPPRVENREEADADAKPTKRRVIRSNSSKSKVNIKRSQPGKRRAPQKAKRD